MNKELLNEIPSLEYKAVSEIKSASFLRDFKMSGYLLWERRV
jgi:hypothetical protein